MFSLFDTEVRFKDPKLVRYKSFEMNRNKPRRREFQVLCWMDER